MRRTIPVAFIYNTSFDCFFKNWDNDDSVCGTAGEYASFERSILWQTGCCTYVPQPKGLHECSPEVLPCPSSEGHFHAIFA